MELLTTQVSLSRIRCYAYHGVLEQERVVGGEYEVSLRLTLGEAEASVLRDCLSGTVNYAEAYALVQREMRQPSALLERVAGRLLQAVFDAFPLVVEAEVEVCKCNPPMGADCTGASVRVGARR